MLENALLAFLTQYLENHWAEILQTFSINAFCDKDERVNLCGQGHGHSMTKAPASGGILSLMQCEF